MDKFKDRWPGAPLECWCSVSILEYGRSMMAGSSSCASLLGHPAQGYHFPGEAIVLQDGLEDSLTPPPPLLP